MRLRRGVHFGLWTSENMSQTKKAVPISGSAVHYKVLAWRHCALCHCILIHDLSRVLFILHLAWTTAV